MLISADLSFVLVLSQATIVLAAELGRRYGDQGIVAMSCNPGVAKTAHYRNLHGVGGVIMVRLNFRTDIILSLYCID